MPATKQNVSLLFFSAEDTDNAEASTCGKILIFLSWVLVFLTMPISLLVCFKVSYKNCDLLSYVNKDTRFCQSCSPPFFPYQLIRLLEEKSYKTEISLVNNWWLNEKNWKNKLPSLRFFQQKLFAMKILMKA